MWSSLPSLSPSLSAIEVPPLPVNIEAYGKLEPFDDGHTPETFLGHDNDDDNDTNNRKYGSRVIHYNYDNILDDSQCPGSNTSNDVDSNNATNDNDNNNDKSESKSNSNEANDKSESASASTSSSFSLNDPMLHVWNNALPQSLTRNIYNKTTASTSTSASASKPSAAAWGTYVTMEEALDHYNTCTHISKGSDSSSNGSACCIASNSNDDNQHDYDQHELAVAAVAHFLFDKPSSSLSSSSSSSSSSSIPEQVNKNSDSFLQTIRKQNNKIISTSSSSLASSVLSMTPPSIHEIIHRNTTASPATTNITTPNTTLKNKDVIHGVGVWSLSSSTSQNVPYHIDYAEYIRYKYNIVIPPLYAGTVQCTPFSSSSSSSSQEQQLQQSQQSQPQKQQSRNENASSTSSMKGGNFAVNLNGWDHYNSFGFKGRRKDDIMGGWIEHKNKNDLNDEGSNNNNNNNNDDVDDDDDDDGNGKHVDENNIHNQIQINHDNQWVTVPYRFNRGILHTGYLPHLSTTCTIDDNSQHHQHQNPHQYSNNNQEDKESERETTSSNNGNNAISDQKRDQSQQQQQQQPLKRVIMGFNIFANDVGPYVAKVPEHSDSFRRWVKWYRLVVLKKPKIFTTVTSTPTSSTTISNNEDGINDNNDDKENKRSSHDTTINNNNSKGMKLDDIRKNKPLMKLMVLFKREKIKKEWEDCRKAMTLWLVKNILLKGAIEENDSEGNDRPNDGPNNDDHNGFLQEDNKINCKARKMKLDEVIKYWKNDRDNDVTNIGDNKSQQSSCNIQVTVDDLIVHIEHLSRLKHVHHHTNNNEYFEIKLSLTDHVKYVYLSPAMGLGSGH